MMRKMYCGTIEGEKVRFGTSEGRAYSLVQGEKDRLLFNVIGISTRQCITIEDPEKGEGFRSVSREVMFYLDPETDEIINSWGNPLTGETVEVFHAANRGNEHHVGVGESWLQFYIASEIDRGCPILELSGRELLTSRSASF